VAFSCFEKVLLHWPLSVGSAICERGIFLLWKKFPENKEKNTAWAPWTKFKFWKWRNVSMKYKTKSCNVGLCYWVHVRLHIHIAVLSITSSQEMWAVDLWMCQDAAITASPDLTLKDSTFCHKVILRFVCSFENKHHLIHYAELLNGFYNWQRNVFKIQSEEIFQISGLQKY
jgi:hypothetical protein